VIYHTERAKYLLHINCNDYCCCSSKQRTCEKEINRHQTSTKEDTLSDLHHDTDRVKHLHHIDCSTYHCCNTKQHTGKMEINGHKITTKMIQQLSYLCQNSINHMDRAKYLLCNNKQHIGEK
jgi:Zn-dependent alcohol dehydrogenase